MSKHSEAVEHFKWLRQYCNDMNGHFGNECKKCVFYKETVIDDQTYKECIADGFRCIESVYQREVLPVVEKRLTELEQREQ